MDNILKKYAANANQSKGRFYQSRDTNGRDVFQRDRDRIIHSKAFRRLAHKTQVFVYYEGDHYRNRLTHSLEVAQISRACARILGVNEDLTELTALAHDLGHPPFGHAGEDALNDVMKPFGGYDHNAQALRIVTLLEDRYPHHAGLNLTIESLEGILKHNGPILDTDLPRAILAFEHYNKLDLHLFAGIEAQIAAICDDIAYNAHDIDDGLRANLFSIDDLHIFPFCSKILQDIKKEYADINPSQYKNEFVRRLISYFVNDMIQNTENNILKLKPESYNDIRHASKSYVLFSDSVDQENKALKSFLLKNMYRHYKILRMTNKAKRVVHDLFQIYFEQPEIMPYDYKKDSLSKNDKDHAVKVADFIAGMTDKFALEEYRRLFELIPGQL